MPVKNAGAAAARVDRIIIVAGKEVQVAAVRI